MPLFVSFLHSLAKATLVYSQLGLLFSQTIVDAGSHKQCTRDASDACLRYGTCCSPPLNPDTCCYNAPYGITIDRYSYNGIFWATRGVR